LLEQPSSAQPPVSRLDSPSPRRFNNTATPSPQEQLNEKRDKTKRQVTTSTVEVIPESEPQVPTTDSLSLKKNLTPAEASDSAPSEDENGVVEGDPTPESAPGSEEEPTTAGESELTEWDFSLPVLPAPATLALAVGQSPNSFNTKDLVGAVQNGASLLDIQKYIWGFDYRIVSKHLSEELVDGFPSIFYAVETNDIVFLRLWASYGASVSAVHPETGTPLLAYAIARSETLDGSDTNLMVATLLSLGATPEDIPKEFYTPYTRDLPVGGPDPESQGADTPQKWYTPAAREKLVHTANLTQRYFLERATKVKKPSIRHRQVAAMRNCEEVLGIPYFLIGQTIAADQLLRKLLSYIMIPNKKPLVLVFAGPSGHGKTELARQLGSLLALDLEVVDCTIVNREIELFGGRHPYVNAEKGSPLNNFIASHAGNKCIVFMDEFEKTTKEIHQALLLPFDNGEYSDRRNGNVVDCSNTIWILATNALDNTIQNFCRDNPDILGDDESKKQHLAKKLSKDLRRAFLQRFHAPVTGRVSSFIPFLPFSAGEQAVVTHKFLLELAHKVWRPISLAAGPNQQLLGGVRLHIRRDASLCAALAGTEYDPQLGARSLANAVKHIEDHLVEKYLEENKEIVENEDMRDFVVDVKGEDIIVTKASPVKKVDVLEDPPVPPIPHP